MLTVLIENGTVIGFDGERHRTLKDGVVVFDKEQIIHVGKSWSGHVDKKVDAQRKLVVPGFINTHCHSQVPLSPHHLTVDARAHSQDYWEKLQFMYLSILFIQHHTCKILTQSEKY
jgi:imidazolonepropionase-like amidohydrolase